MFGDTVPAEELIDLLQKYPKLIAYVDDSDGMSWTGNMGAGSFLSKVPYHERLFMAMSTNRTGGAIMIYPENESKNLVRNYGSSIVFSGPLSPSMIMSGIKATEIHKRPEFSIMQKKLSDLIYHFIKIAGELNIPLIRDDKTQVFFIGMAHEEPTIFVAKGLQKAEFFVDVAGYLSVPKNNLGIRITLTNYLSFTDVENFLYSLSELITILEKENKFSTPKVLKIFKNQNNSVVKKYL